MCSKPLLFNAIEYQTENHFSLPQFWDHIWKIILLWSFKIDKFNMIHG